MRPSTRRAPAWAVLASLCTLAGCDDFTQEPSPTSEPPERQALGYAPPPAQAPPAWLRPAPELRTTASPGRARGKGKHALLTNGSFERNGGEATNEFTGWTEVDLSNSSGSWLVQTGGNSPLNLTPVGRPTDGAFAAMTDQFGPGAHILYQDVQLPAHGPVALGFDLAIQNFAGEFVTPATFSFDEIANQQFRMDVMDPNAPVDDLGSGVLLPVYRTEAGDPATSGYRTIVVSLRQFAGRVVRLRFAEVDNISNFLVGIDRVTVARHVRHEKIRDRATATTIPFAPEPGPFAHVLTLEDDATTGLRPIGFTFTFFGHRYTEFNLSSNGFIGFDADMPNGCCFGGVIPSDDGLNNVIAASWVDLLPPEGGRIAYETRGTAPDRRLVISYRDVPVFGEAARVTTEIILYERRSAIEIHTARQDLSDSHLYTQGVENAAGTAAGFIPGRVAENYGLRRDGVRFTTKSPGGGRR
ncbi:MAG TPA: hypothetical protein VFG66_11390 [Gemmatimonadales bacterium]|nr:hypothetical protein [Gemmatimonadales bacterium]